MSLNSQVIFLISPNKKIFISILLIQQSLISAERISALHVNEKNKNNSKTVFVSLSEIERRLQAVNSLLSPEPLNRTRSRCGAGNLSTTVEEPQDDDDVIITTGSGSQSALDSSSAREIPLKIRCRTDIHKIPVLSVRTERNRPHNQLQKLLFLTLTLFCFLLLHF